MSKKSGNTRMLKNDKSLYESDAVDFKGENLVPEMPVIKNPVLPTVTFVKPVIIAPSVVPIKENRGSIDPYDSASVGSKVAKAVKRKKIIGGLLAMLLIVLIAIGGFFTYFLSPGYIVKNATIGKEAEVSKEGETLNILVDIKPTLINYYLVSNNPDIVKIIDNKSAYAVTPGVATVSVFSNINNLKIGEVSVKIVDAKGNFDYKLNFELNADERYLKLPSDVNVDDAYGQRTIISKKNFGEIVSPSRTDGYIFVGWFYDNQLTKKYFVDDVISSDTVLFAKWMVDPITVTDGLPLANGIYGTNYQFDVKSNTGNGSGNYTYALANENVLPNGLTITLDGIISGVPTKQGTFEFIITGTDSLNGSKAHARFSITIEKAVIENFIITTAPLTYNGQIQSVTASAVTGVDTINDVVNVTLKYKKFGDQSGNFVVPIDAGKYIAVVDVVDNENYIIKNTKYEKEFTISPKKITAVFNKKSVVFNGQDKTTEFAEGISATGLVSRFETNAIDKVSFFVTSDKGGVVNVDTYLLTIDENLGNTNYVLSQTFEENVKVTQRKLKFSTDKNYEKTYGELDPTVAIALVKDEVLENANDLQSSYLDSDSIALRSILLNGLSRVSGQSVNSYIYTFNKSDLTENLGVLQNYNLEFVSGNSLKIVKRELTLTQKAGSDGLIKKTYDGKLSADITDTYNFSNLMHGDEVSLVGTVAKYIDKNVNENISVLISSGISNNNYSLENVSSFVGQIVPRQLTLTQRNSIKKTYDSQTSFDDGKVKDYLSLNGVLKVYDEVNNKYLLSDETVTITEGKITFNGADVNTNTADVCEIKISSSNYNVPETFLSASAIIESRELRFVGKNGNLLTKIYDGNNVFNQATQLNNIDFAPGYAPIENESVTLSFEQEFDSVNAGGRFVKIYNLSLGINDINYKIAVNNNMLNVNGAKILAKELKFVGKNGNGAIKTYDGTTNIDGITQANNIDFETDFAPIDGEVVNIKFDQAFDDKNVGTKVVKISNIAFSVPNKNYVIMEGNNIIDISGAKINAKELRFVGINGSSLTKAYDKTKSFDKATQSNNIGYQADFAPVLGETVALDFSQEFDSQNAGTDRVVKITNITLKSAVSNYVIHSGYDEIDILNAIITKKELRFATVGKTDLLTKIYDGTAGTSLVTAETNIRYAQGYAPVMDDVVTIYFNQEFDSKDVGERVIKITNISLVAGQDNYEIKSNHSALDISGSITKKALQFVGQNGESLSKQYDGTTKFTAVTQIDNIAYKEGFAPISGEVVSLSFKQELDNKNVGNGIRIAKITNIALSVTDINYSIDESSLAIDILGVSVLKKELKFVGKNGNLINKIFDGNTDVTGNLVTQANNISYAIGFSPINNETVEVSFKQQYDSKDGGNRKILITDLALINENSNYTIANESKSIEIDGAKIEAKELRFQPKGNASSFVKVYDGTTSVSGVTLENNLEYVSGYAPVTGASVSVSFSQEYDNKNTGDRKLKITKIRLTSEVSNYIVYSSYDSLMIEGAGIMQKQLRFVGKNGESLTKTYDGTTAITSVTQQKNIAYQDEFAPIQSEIVTLSFKQAFDNANSGDRSIIIKEIAISSDDTNYYIDPTYNTINVDGAKINQKELRFYGKNGEELSKIYDGTTAITNATQENNISYASGFEPILNENVAVLFDQEFDSKDVGGRKVAITNIRLTDETGNYKILTEHNTIQIVATITARTANIQKILNVVDDMSVRKSYDAKLKLVVDDSTQIMVNRYLSVNNLVEGDNLSFSFMANYNDKNVGLNKTLTLTGFGVSNGNYRVDPTFEFSLTDSTISIEKAEISVKDTFVNINGQYNGANWVQKAEFNVFFDENYKPDEVIPVFYYLKDSLNVQSITSAVGSYKAVISHMEGEDSANYKLPEESNLLTRDLTVTPYELTKNDIIAQISNRTFNGDDLKPSADKFTIAKFDEVMSPILNYQVKGSDDNYYDVMQIIVSSIYRVIIVGVNNANFTVANDTFYQFTIEKAQLDLEYAKKSVEPNNRYTASDLIKFEKVYSATSDVLFVSDSHKNYNKFALNTTFDNFVPKYTMYVKFETSNAGDNINVTVTIKLTNDEVNNNYTLRGSEIAVSQKGTIHKIKAEYTIKDIGGVIGENEVYQIHINGIITLGTYTYDMVINNTTAGDLIGDEVAPYNTTAKYYKFEYNKIYRIEIKNVELHSPNANYETLGDVKYMIMTYDQGSKFSADYEDLTSFVQ